MGLTVGSVSTLKLSFLFSLHLLVINLYKMYNIPMKIISTTTVRKNMSDMLDAVVADGANFVIGRHKEPEAVLIKFPSLYRSDVSDITNINSYSNSFDFLKDEPELYTLEDIKIKHV